MLDCYYVAAIMRWRKSVIAGNVYKELDKALIIYP